MRSDLHVRKLVTIIQILQGYAAMEGIKGHAELLLAFEPPQSYWRPQAILEVTSLLRS